LAAKELKNDAVCSLKLAEHAIGSGAGFIDVPLK
jgi:hypothetical protein